MSGKQVKFLYLSEKDMINAGVLNAKRCVEVIEEAFDLLGKGDYIMGGVSENDHGHRLYFPVEKKFNMPVAGPDRRFMAMVAYLGGRFNVCGQKWYGSNIENPKRGLPRSILMVTLNNPDTAEPLVYMSANLLSAMRTGSVPAVAAKHLASKDSQVIGVIGAGVINKATVRSMAAVLHNAKEVKVYDLFKDKAEAFCESLADELGLKLHAVDSVEEAVKNSDVITIATSGAKSPEIKTEWIKEGAFLATSATADFSEDIFLTSKVVVDEWKMHLSWKEEENSIPEDQAAKRLGFPSKYLFKLIDEGKMKETDISSLGPIVAGKDKCCTCGKKRTIFISGGLPIEDVAWGYEVYQEALKKGIGQELILWDEPYWF